jgi:hypothetical protein
MPTLVNPAVTSAATDRGRAKMVDFPWSNYALLQAELRDDYSIGNRSWGLEAALNRLVSNNPPANDNEIQRVIKSEQRRERNRAALRRLHLGNGAGFDPEASLQAQISLKSLKAKVSSSDWRLLFAVGIGRDYAEIVGANGGTAGALRVRVFRFRREAAPGH